MKKEQKISIQYDGERTEWYTYKKSVVCSKCKHCIIRDYIFEIFLSNVYVFLNFESWIESQKRQILAQSQDRRAIGAKDPFNNK